MEGIYYNYINAYNMRKMIMKKKYVITIITGLFIIAAGICYSISYMGKKTAPVITTLTGNGADNLAADNQPTAGADIGQPNNDTSAAEIVSNDNQAQAGDKPSQMRAVLP